MPRTIPTGEQSFATLRTDNSFYIDKTKFIKEWWNNRDRVLRFYWLIAIDWGSLRQRGLILSQCGIATHCNQLLES